MSEWDQDFWGKYQVLINLAFLLPYGLKRANTFMKAKNPNITISKWNFPGNPEYQLGASISHLRL